MCLGAILWGRFAALYYANSRAEAAAIGFDDAAFYQEVAAPPHARTLPSRRHLPEEAREVFREWTKKPDKIRY
jgi:tRNA(Arg) A34 adenosine deaminase TadA